MIDNQIADKITKVSRSSRRNSSKAGESEVRNIRFDKEILTKRYISSEKRQEIIDDLWNTKKR